MNDDHDNAITDKEALRKHAPKARAAMTRKKKARLSIGQVVARGDRPDEYHRIIGSSLVGQRWQHKLCGAVYFYDFGDDERDLRPLTRRERGEKGRKR